MVKKVRDLSEEEKNAICDKYAEIGTCSDKCPLYLAAVGEQGLFVNC